MCREVKRGGPGCVLGTLFLGLRAPLVLGLGDDKIAPAAQPEMAPLLLQVTRGPRPLRL